MPILHMETERVRGTGQQLRQLADTVQGYADSCARTASAVEWEGPSRESFLAEMDDLARRLRALAEQGEQLGMKATSEADEWEEAARLFGEGGYGIGHNMGIIGVGITAGTAHYVQILEARRAFREAWRRMSVDVRIAFLQQRHNEIANEYGFAPRPVMAEDLQDPEGGDARGELRGRFLWFGGQMVIDIDNVKDDDPIAVLRTMAHESGHAIQHHLVDHPDQRPDHISEEQISSWRDNFNDYHKPEDDFRRYREQPVEVDARGFGDEYVDGYFESQVD